MGRMKINRKNIWYVGVFSIMLILIVVISSTYYSLLARDERFIQNAPYIQPTGLPLPTVNPAFKPRPYLVPWPAEIDFKTNTVLVSTQFKFNTDSTSDILLQAIGRYMKLIPFEYIAWSDSSKQFPTIDSCDITVDSDNEDLFFGVDESYTLEITEQQQCQLKSPTVFGALKALETFSQLINMNANTGEMIMEYTPISISDRPRFPHRGILLDVSRHFYPVTDIKHFVDAIAYAKMNIFHLHLVDAHSFPLESKVYPNMTLGAYNAFEIYKQSDIIDIIEYAKYRGVRVIPEIDVPGHCQSWGFAFPEVLPTDYQKMKDCHWDRYAWANVPLDVTKPKSTEVATALINETMQLFGNEQFIHIGGDEVLRECWQNNEITQFIKENNLDGFDGLERWFDSKMHSLVLSANKSPIVWEETFFLYGKKISETHVIDVDLPKDVVIHLYHELELTRDIVSQGYRCIVSNAWSWYLDLTPPWQAYYTNEISQYIDNNDPEQVKLLIGGETCLWSENIDLTTVFKKVWPKSGAAAERLWSSQSMNNLDEFEPRLMSFNCHLYYRGYPVTQTDIMPGPCQNNQLN